MSGSFQLIPRPERFAQASGSRLFAACGKVVQVYSVQLSEGLQAAWIGDS